MKKLKSTALATVSKAAKPLQKTEIIAALVERERQLREQEKSDWDAQLEKLQAALNDAAKMCVVDNAKNLTMHVRRGYEKNLIVEIIVPSSFPGYPSKKAEAIEAHRQREPRRFNDVVERERIVRAMETERTSSILRDPASLAALDSIRERLNSIAG